MSPFDTTADMRAAELSSAEPVAPAAAPAAAKPVSAEELRKADEKLASFVRKPNG